MAQEAPHHQAPAATPLRHLLTLGGVQEAPALEHFPGVVSELSALCPEGFRIRREMLLTALGALCEFFENDEGEEPIVPIRELDADAQFFFDVAVDTVANQDHEDPAERPATGGTPSSSSRVQDIGVASVETARATRTATRDLDAVLAEAFGPEVVAAKLPLPLRVSAVESIVIEELAIFEDDQLVSDGLGDLATALRADVLEELMAHAADLRTRISTTSEGGRLSAVSHLKEALIATQKVMSML